MRRSTTLAIAVASMTASAQTFTVTYDLKYDVAGTSLSTVACGDGSNGLSGAFPTFGSLPSFPRIGGVPAITVWNDVDCASCWTLTYVDAHAVARSISALGIDIGGPTSNNFNIAKGAMDLLTGGQASQLGKITVGAVRVARSVCGLE